MEMPISRRRLLKLLAAGAGGVCLNTLCGGSDSRLLAEELDDPTLSTSVAAGVSATYPGRVIHVHSDQATSWVGQTDYWNYVNQNVVNDMVDQGMMALTGTTTVADAWRTLLPDYRSGQGIAMKVNFNNWGDQLKIDALIQPVNAVVRGLKQMGVAEPDVWVYDATRPMGNRFVERCQYNGVRFFGLTPLEPPGWSSTDPHAYVAFSPPSGVPMPPATRLPDVLVNARYLINMPIIKRHGSAGLSLAFKNHFGSINYPGGLHDYVRVDYGGYDRDGKYNALLDLYRSPHIGAKTVLTIADGLFGAELQGAVPVLWSTFGNRAPNSLFFATDPVAIDCVMCDFLAAEWGIVMRSDNYLRLAGQAGLGVYERGDPWGAGYFQVDYLRVSTPLPPTAAVVLIGSNDSDITLTWQHDVANTSYEVWRGTSPWFTTGAGGTRLAVVAPPASGSALSYTDGGAVGDGVPKYYLVRAMNVAGAFEHSNRVGTCSFAL